ncbi:MAG: NAD-dependent succinate-semialdehyde dehydrogenase [Vicinamibacteraceae bacterium]
MIESPLLVNVKGFIGGHWSGALSGRTLPVVNPATGEHLANVPDMDANDAVRAVEAAAEAFSRDVPNLEQRRRWLSGIADRLLAHTSTLARIITLEQGKPLKESAVEIEYSAGFFSFYATNLHHLEPEPLPEPVKSLRWTIHRRPAGVSALITPWNFPLAMLAKKVAPALAAGCTIVAKPADLTPLSAIAFWALVDDDGLDVDAGRLNLVIGQPGPIGDVLCSHPSVRCISFTGSTRVGKLLIEKTAPHIKHLSLELGGNAPFIVMDDADAEVAADALLANKFRCAGQTCVCANRVYVHRSLEDTFVRAVVERVSRLHVGDGTDPHTDIGPLINRAAFDKVRRHVADAVTNGARRAVGGDAPTLRENWGAFYPPTVLTSVEPEMAISREETFGPIVPISTFDSEDQVIALANGTPHGLAAYLFTRDAARAQRLIRRLTFGHVGLNTGMGPTPEAPFGGTKQSGFGREGGIEGLFEFCETQTVASNSTNDRT